jgi:PAS domain S-box-containing protein
MRKAIAKVRTSGEPASIEYALPVPGGNRYFESRLMPFADDTVLVLARDVTDRKTAEQALRASEKRYRSLYMDNPSMYFTLTVDGIVLSVNEFGARQLGYSVRELEGKPVFRVFHPADRRAVRQQLADCLANSDELATWQVRKVRKDGSIIWVDERARVSKDSTGNPIILIVCEDITERHEMEASLRASQARLSAFAHAVPDVAFILDEDGTYVEVLGLPQRKALLYREAWELEGKRLHEVLPKHNADAFLGLIRRTIATQEVQVLEYQLDTAAGRRWFEGRTAPLPLVERKRMVVWVAHDITDRKQAEQALIDMREELERKAEAIAGPATRYGLTFREVTVLQLLVSGKSDREIGATLGISPLTANKHVGNLMRKMKVRSRTSASVAAMRDGLAV